MMNNEVSSFMEELTEILNKYGKFLCYTRGIEFQKYSITKLEAFKKKSVTLKKEMTDNGHEESANIMLSLQEFLNAYIKELEMLVFLKEDKMHEAWKSLVESQYSLRSALQASDIVIGLGAENRAKRLFLIEDLLFPSQTFVSIGVTAESSECSVCGREYGKCNHVKGKPYMGELCCRVITKIKKINEVSILTKEPANKLSGIKSFLDKGHWRDLMTWRINKCIESKAVDQRIKYSEPESER
jgi:hypothetical protein